MGTEHISQVSTPDHAMRKFVKNEQCLSFLYCAALGFDMNGFAIFKGGKYVQSTLEGIHISFLHYNTMLVPTGGDNSFELKVYVTALVHTDVMIRGMKSNTHPTYKAETRIYITVYLVSTGWKLLLHKSGMGTSIKDLNPYMLINNNNKIKSRMRS